ncbi:preprotein translocase subunit SecA [Tenuifilum sp.]|uniref:preprotein translocase subunit SecA n=2 Tax=Tenuifilum sp. TaxID=2760880 RepID=UPI001B5C0C7A|nr:preprotein translocase subunit SecA [Bacteroidales bacterium]HOK61851.1 preprotein translocase subunit SecA [Tenuifilum sp.]HOK86571.1 preprotein translocase subunit SecA [Tenuifilum sp.]HON70094.1 preprotein translocase subunit SecA [Tenuifilum sp.]HPP90891.1 preprotein translocase subunit SecA [Tenuifilum sp.]
MGLSNFLTKFFGTKSDRDLRELMPIVNKIREAYPRYTTLTNDQLREETDRLRKVVRDYIAEDEAKVEQLKAQMESDEIDYEEKERVYKEVERLTKQIDDKIEEVLNQVLPDAFSIVKETARRFKENEIIEVTATQFDRDLAARKDFVTIQGDKAIYKNRWMAGGNEIVWDMVHYDVQLIGGVVLHQGKIAEMATGEGKTLVATLPVFLNALAGKGVHVVTVNDYLARRDSEWMGPIYEFHGLSVDCIDKHQPNSEARRKAYNCDITYGTNNEFGFDYLRDNMAIAPDDLVQRKHHYAIVDEVDSVLIDDARTPLIISGPVPKGEDQMFEEYKPKVEKLVNAQRSLITQLLTDARKLISEGNTEEGGKLLLRAHKGWPKYKPLIKFLSEQGNKALLLKTENFYMQDNNRNMHLITDDLYFVIDEKQNSVELTDKGIDLITSSAEDPKFFVLPDIGSEIAEIEKMSITQGEKLTKKDELLREYAVKSERVHTVHQLLKAYTMFEKDVEYVVMDNKVKIVDEQTGRILEGRRYSDGLHQAIEAKERVKVEAATQTFATITLQNYFRMYHKLAGMTGTAETEAGEFWSIYKLDVVVIPTNKPVVRKDMEDLVYKTKREKYNAVIDEIVRLRDANRPVLVGTTSVEVSELLSRMLKLKGIQHNVLNAKQHQREAEIVAHAGIPKTVTIATNMAGRGTDIKLTPESRAAGGLAIIGTERHESRRVDRQLRGRSGRQGDPGTSQFYVSLEDDLMRLFGSDRIARVMDAMGHKEGDVIQHSMVSKSIERAQKKVEENNFGIRKRLLEYDDVMNAQREVIYKRRRHALFGERLDVDISNMFMDVCEAIVNEFHGNYEYDDFKLEIIKQFSLDVPITEDEYLELKPSEIAHRLYKVALESYDRKAHEIARQAYPVIKEVYEKQSAIYENIVVPISDGQKVYQTVTNLKKAYETGGKELIRSFTKNIILFTIDEYWKEHLREMDELKQSVQNAVYEQKDPLLIYKLEAFDLFRTMIDKLNRDIVAVLVKAFIPLRDPNQVQEARQSRRTDMSQYQTSRTDNLQPGANTQEQSRQPVKVEVKVGRNDPCPCGSGKKYKNCHGKNL